MDCIFCKIMNGDIPSFTLYEDEIVKVFLDVNPETNGHSLIVPKKHYQDLFDIPNDVLMHIMDTARKMDSLFKEKLDSKGLTLIQNNGIVQEVKHYHMHLLPKYDMIVSKVDAEDVFHQIMD